MKTRKNGFFAGLFLGLGVICSSLLTSCSDQDEVYPSISTTVYSVLYDSVYDRYGDRIVYADYRMTLDAAAGLGDTILVYNVDSLPYQSDVSRVRLTVSTSATVFMETAPGTLRHVTSADSVDARTPIILHAAGSDSKGNVLTQILKLEFRVHQINADSVAWRSYSGTPNFTGRVKTLIFGERLYVFTEHGNAYYTNTGTPGTWTTVTGLPANFDYVSPTVFAGKLYLIAEGKVYTSENGNTYTVQPTLSLGDNVEALLGATSDYLSAVKGGYYQSTQGATWQQGGLAAGFIRTGMNACTYALATNPEIEQIALLGKPKPEDTRHSLLVAEQNLLNWGNWGPVDTVGFYLPFDADHVLIRYAGDQFYVFGGSGREAFDHYYTSQGLYWRKRPSRGFFLEAFKGREHMDAIVDKDNYIWLVFSQSSKPAAVYRGRLNSYNL